MNTTAYATEEDLDYRISAAYAVPANWLQLVIKAGELIDEATLYRSRTVWAGDDESLKDVITQATCDQVEFWLETGEEHDVAGLRGSLVAGRVQLHPVSPILSPRAMRTLLVSGLAWRGVGM